MARTCSSAISGPFILSTTRSGTFTLSIARERAGILASCARSSTHLVLRSYPQSRTQRPGKAESPRLPVPRLF